MPEASRLPLLPAEPGAYALHLRLEYAKTLQVGRLGQVPFPAGDYLYLGSARGPGGLRARLSRHLRLAKRPHWHIDALRAIAQVLGLVYLVSADLTPLPYECAWSQALAAWPGTHIPAPGFGASDCSSGCPAHLVAFPPGALSPSALPETLRGQLAQAAGVAVDRIVFRLLPPVPGY